MSEVGFLTMGDARSEGEIPPIGVGMLGYAFMGKAHSHAYRTLSYMTWPPPLMPQLVAIAGRSEEAVAEAARRYGYASHTTDWRALLSDERIQLFDNAGPNNLHAEPTIAAAEAGKHVICEKPLGRDAAESYETWQRVAATGVTHMCAFNYRFVPAVRLARLMIEAGELGEIHHFRGSYLQEWGTAEGEIWRFDKALAGSGAIGDLASHVVDLSRYLVGEIAEVSAITADVPARAATWTTPSSRRSASRTAPSARSRPRASARGARTTSPGRSTAPRARWPSTSSGSTSCRHSARATPASARSWSRRPTTRSGSTGGRRAT